VNTARPLDGITSLKVKLGLLVAVSIVVAVVVERVADAGQVPWWISVPVTWSPPSRSPSGSRAA
jgi:two-component system sensor histidine kinase BaeS